MPGGQTDAAVKSSVTQSGVRSVIYAGSTSLFNFFAPTGFADKMLIRRNNASKTVATQDTLDAIDSAITRGQTIVLMLHDIDSGGVGEILSSELTAICAHIKLRMDQGLINNPNYADWINI